MGYGLGAAPSSPRVPVSSAASNGYVRRMPHRVSDSAAAFSRGPYEYDSSSLGSACDTQQLGSGASPGAGPAHHFNHNQAMQQTASALHRTLDQLTQALAPLSISLMRVDRQEQLSAAVDAMVGQLEAKTDAETDPGAGLSGDTASAPVRIESTHRCSTHQQKTRVPVFVVSALSGLNLGLFTDFFSLLSIKLPTRPLAIPTTPSPSVSSTLSQATLVKSTNIESDSKSNSAAHLSSSAHRETHVTVFSVIQVFQGIDSDHSLPVLYGTLLKYGALNVLRSGYFRSSISRTGR